MGLFEAFVVGFFKSLDKMAKVEKAVKIVVTVLVVVLVGWGVYAWFSHANAVTGTVHPAVLRNNVTPEVELVSVARVRGYEVRGEHSVAVPKFFSAQAHKNIRANGEFQVFVNFNESGTQITGVDILRHGKLLKSFSDHLTPEEPKKVVRLAISDMDMQVQ